MNKPLADRIRPTELSEVVGQRHLLSPGKPLYNMIENGEITTAAEGIEMAKRLREPMQMCR